MRLRGDKDVPGESVARHKQQREFIKQGLAVRDEARRTDEYHYAKAVHAELHRMLAKRARKVKS